MLAILSYEYPIVLIVLLLELAITINSLFAFSINKNVQSSKLGKVKTFVLDASISIIYIIVAKEIYASNIPKTIYSFISKYSSDISYTLIGIIEEIIYMLTDRDFYINHKDKSLKELLYK